VLEFGDVRNRITIRPSGTEPKLKFYTQWFNAVDEMQSVVDQYSHLDIQLQALAKELEKVLVSF
jgi:phosphomannomutase